MLWACPPHAGTPPPVPNLRHPDRDAQPRPAALRVLRARLRGRAPGGSVEPTASDDRAAPPVAASTGAIGRTAWETALAGAVGDPRLRPLSVVRVVFDAPGVTGPGRSEELARLEAVSTVVWRQILRPGDTLARLGPSSFVVLLPRCDATAAAVIAGRLGQAAPDAAHCRLGVAGAGADEPADGLVAAAERALEGGLAALHDPARLDAARAAIDLAAGTGLHDLARSTAHVVGASAVAITVVGHRHRHLLGIHGADQLGGSAHELPVERTLCRHVIATGHPVLVSDTTRHGVVDATGAERALGIAASASVPLRVCSQLVGTVCAMRRDRYEWTDDDVSALRLAAARVAEQLGTRDPATGGRPQVQDGLGQPA